MLAMPLVAQLSDALPPYANVSSFGGEVNNNV